jgi:hypothetical protein
MSKNWMNTNEQLNISYSMGLNIGISVAKMVTKKDGQGCCKRKPENAACIFVIFSCVGQCAFFCTVLLQTYCILSLVYILISNATLSECLLQFIAFKARYTKITF